MLQNLRNLYPWPNCRPDMPENWHGWFADKTADALRAAYEHDPRLIVECGTWLGFSARAHLQSCPQADVICIDTWEGSAEHTAPTAPEEWRNLLPLLYSQCIANLWQWRDRTTLIAEDSFAGLVAIKQNGIVPHLIYLDSEHTPQRVFGELALCRKFWPDARIVLDDCNNPAVGNAVEVYCQFCQDKLMRTTECAWTIEPGGWA